MDDLVHRVCGKTDSGGLSGVDISQRLVRLVVKRRACEAG